MERPPLVEPLDAFDDLLRTAPAVPLTDQVRLRRGDALALLSAMRTSPDATATTLALLDELERLVSDARRIPLTRDVRLEAERARAILDRLRSVQAAGSHLPA